MFSLQEAFWRLDKDMDGKISLVEFQQAMPNSPVTPRAVPNSPITPRAVTESPAAGTEALFAAADMDKSGAIEFTEFIAVMLDSCIVAK